MLDKSKIKILTFREEEKGNDEEIGQERLNEKDGGFKD